MLAGAGHGVAGRGAVPKDFEEITLVPGHPAPKAVDRGALLFQK